MNPLPWERAYSEYDDAYEDYTGIPRGENWPHPPISDLDTRGATDQELARGAANLLP